MEQKQQQHFLVVTYPVQSHINPGLHLAKRLTQTTGALVTFCTAASAHRVMFPSTTTPDQEVEDGLITYIPYSDRDINGNKPESDGIARLESKSFSSLVQNLADRGRRVTYIICTLLLTWAADVAREHGIPSAQYWIQPATTFAIYYHYFHGYDTLITAHSKDSLFTVNLPGLPPLQIRDLPSFLTSSASDDLYSRVLPRFRETFEALDREQSRSKPKVLVNTFDELEADALSAVDKVDLIAIGPILPSFPIVDGGKDPEDNSNVSGFDLFKPDEKGYMEWLDSKPEKSVVYVSFGSISVVKKQQMEEISRGLRESGRPYLWVVRKDSRWEGVELEEGDKGMVVEWCTQVRVLSHPSVGCFVTHCGWNSTVESLVCGVPMIGMPQWSDQGTNAMLVEKAWGTAVRGEVNDDGVLEGRELRRCLDLVMGEEERGVEIRRKAELWREKAREAVSEGGSSDRNLRVFVEEITKYD